MQFYHICDKPKFLPKGILVFQKTTGIAPINSVCDEIKLRLLFFNLSHCEGCIWQNLTIVILLMGDISWR